MINCRKVLQLVSAVMRVYEIAIKRITWKVLSETEVRRMFFASFP